jgi:hypothetical protein
MRCWASPEDAGLSLDEVRGMISDGTRALVERALRATGEVVDPSASLGTSLELELDHLLLALGAETNFFDIPGVHDWAVHQPLLTSILIRAFRRIRFSCKIRLISRTAPSLENTR